MKSIQPGHRQFGKSVLVVLLLHAVAIQAATTVTNIAAGGFQSFFLRSDGSVWGMGYYHRGNEDGSGVYIWVGAYFPTPILSSKVVAIAAGESHSLFLKSDGSVWAAGFGDRGEFGDGTHGYFISTPEQVMTNVVAVAAGDSHSLFIRSDCSLWATGLNAQGQLGDSTTNNSSVPELIVHSNVTAVAAGSYHSLFLKDDGSLWAMGYNNWGQLGDGTTNNRYTPQQIVSGGVTAIAAGGFHSLFLKSNGSLWAVGHNEFGQLGNGSATDFFNYSSTPEQIVSNDVVAITGGGAHSLFRKSDGSLWGMGYSHLGQLGDGGLTFAVIVPQLLVSNNVTAIAAGLAHSLFLKSDGILWGMGDNYDNELGNGFRGNSLIPEQIFPLPQPQPLLTVNISSKSNLLFKATCEFGGTFYLLSGANLTQPRSQWIPVWTNSVTTRGTNNFTATLTNAVNSGGGRRFYILRSQ